MKYGVLGTGMVGQALAGKLVALGHDVMMGSRGARNPKAIAWAQSAGPRAQVGTFAETAVFGELLFNCTHGANSVEALRAAGEKPLAGKVLIDVANILPPDTRGVESLGEQIQKAFPRTHVVKALNTMNCEVMVDVSKVSGSHTVFMSGDAPPAKRRFARCSKPSAGRTSSISEASPPRAPPRTTCHSGWPCGTRWAPRTSTSRSSASGPALRAGGPETVRKARPGDRKHRRHR